MEKLMVEAYDMECMKMALLKHEATFKQQVYELHRLYEIQRMLMKKMMQNIIINEESLKNGNRYDEKQLNNNDVQKQDNDAYSNVNDGDENENENENEDDEMEEESEIELTLGPTTKEKKKKKKKPLKSSSSAGLGMFSAASSSSTDRNTRLITLHNNSLLDQSRSTACT